MFDAERIRRDFPILSTASHGKRFVYLDSAATSQKPKSVIDAIVDYYNTYNANINRGVYEISERATDAFIASKEKLAKFIGAHGIEETIYVRNATEALNLVALSWGERNIKSGDRILITEMEHHSNIVPWQMLAKRKGAVLDYVKLTHGMAYLDMEDLEAKLEKSPKLVSVTHVSNVLGTVNDVKRITKLAHECGATVLIDGAQSVPHMRVDVAAIGCDFMALSGHKMLAPTGIGALYGRRELLEAMEPVLGGGDMIRSVSMHGATWNDLPWKFEAGTSNIEGAIGLGAALDYLDGIGMDSVREHEQELTRYAMDRFSEINAVSVFGPPASDIENRSGVMAFAIKGVHPHDVATIFDREGIAIRAGHHCAMPLVTQLVTEKALSRMSFYIYNTKEDVDRVVDAIGVVKRIMRIKD